jgi:hypothetical protein
LWQLTALFSHYQHQGNKREHENTQHFVAHNRRIVETSFVFGLVTFTIDDALHITVEESGHTVVPFILFYFQHQVLPEDLHIKILKAHQHVLCQVQVYELIECGVFREIIDRCQYHHHILARNIEQVFYYEKSVNFNDNFSDNRKDQYLNDGYHERLQEY